MTNVIGEATSTNEQPNECFELCAQSLPMDHDKSGTLLDIRIGDVNDSRMPKYRGINNENS